METHKRLEDSEADLEEGSGRDRGASVIEYALLIGLIVLICIAAITVLGGTASTRLSTTALSLQ